MQTFTNVEVRLSIYLISVEEYIRNLQNGELLEDKLSKNDFAEIVDAKNLFPNHLTYTEIHKKIQEKTLHQGVYRASRDNFLEGFVTVEGFDEPVS